MEIEFEGFNILSIESVQEFIDSIFRLNSKLLGWVNQNIMYNGNKYDYGMKY